MARPRKTRAPVEPAYGPTMRVRVLWPNVGTSQGKKFKGDEFELPTDEAMHLDSLDAIKIVGGENA